MKKLTSKFNHPDGWEPSYKSAPGQGKKPMMMRALKASVGARLKHQKISLPRLTFMEDK
ncbi:hypothetical protein UFOVP155_69 [uncultured Caudovirales phage]|uniref:Uncharacterized protein n=1 Tax=uncultured Caudovirales phage TaxID=2100421 RepID=A0A6J7W8X4_9CAUD|nr:hypothetical protein UFOVP155_69 [uncultured Caudovirales phage]